MIETDIQITAGDLYDYMLMHSYSSFGGILGSAIGALCVITALSTRQWIYLLAGILLLLYLPWTLFLKSRRQVLGNPVFQKPMHYMLDDQGITISQGEASESQKWENMVKAVSTGRSIILYTSRSMATIFPRKQLGAQQNAVIEMIHTHMPPEKVKIRF